MVPLTMSALSALPFRFRVLPAIYNRKCKAIFEEVLIGRDRAKVDAAWCGWSIDEQFRITISDYAASYFYWSRPLFVPQDECSVLFRCWRRGLADGMELEQFVMDVESLIDRGFPKISLPSVTFGELLKKLSFRADG